MRMRTMMVLVSLVLAACGDGDEPGRTMPPTDRTGTASNLQQYCEKLVELETVSEPFLEPQTSAEERKAATKKHFRERILPLAEQLPPLAPAEVQADLRARNEAARRIAQHGDPGREFSDRKVQAARSRAHAHDFRSAAGSA